MASIFEKDSKASNIEKLLTIVKLLPNKSDIKVNSFIWHYPDCNNVPKQEDLDEFIAQLLAWYDSSISTLLREKRENDERLKEKEKMWTKFLKENDERLKEKEKMWTNSLRENDERLKEKEKMWTNSLRENDERLKEKEKMWTNSLRENDERLKEKEKMWIKLLEEKDGRLKEKENYINHLMGESRDVLTTLKDVALRDNVKNRKWSTMTRSQAWHLLDKESRVKEVRELTNQQHVKKSKLESAFGKISTNKWKEEKHMYSDIIKAMDSAFYTENSGPKVVDTHDKGDFRPDVCVSDYSDEKFAYCLWYFIEFKLPSISLVTPNHCGQMLDYFHKTHEKQPHRRDFVGILSNFESTWIFTACYDETSVTISKRPAQSLTDAIIYADAQSQLQFTKRIPNLDTRLSPNFDVLAVGKHHFVLEVQRPAVESAKVYPTADVTSKYNTRRKPIASTDHHAWQPPCRHRMTKTFVLKVVHGRTNVTQEIEILKMMRDANCVHLPELVWEPGGEREFGILPVCEPIRFEEPRKVSKKIVAGLMNGLKWLHSHDIIHRDIRPSNLVIDGLDNLVIIDYETAVVRVEGKEVEYMGGFICWPKRLIESNRMWYVPEPEDDLFASILAVSHMIFPTRFEGFRVSSIGVVSNGESRSHETQRLLDLWKDIEGSEQWGAFANAARDRDYEGLKKMGDIFCHI